MKKTKNKLLTGLLVLILSLSTVQIYAATILDTNVINLITSGIHSIFNLYNNEATISSDNLNDTFREKISQYIISKADEVNNRLDAHVNEEIIRANEELNTYYEDLTTETDQLVEEQIENAEENITNNINYNIEDIKSQLAKELEKGIKEKMK